MGESELRLQQITSQQGHCPVKELIGVVNALRKCQRQRLKSVEALKSNIDLTFVLVIVHYVKDGRVPFLECMPTLEPSELTRVTGYLLRLSVGNTTNLK